MSYRSLSGLLGPVVLPPNVALTPQRVGFLWTVWRRTQQILRATSSVFLALCLLIYSNAYPIERLVADRGRGSTTITDAQGKPLRDILSATGERQQWVEGHQISPWLIASTLAGEDQRFWDHPGVDPLGVLRALVDNFDHGRFYSGASTLSMQLVRLVDPELKPGAGLVDKVIQAVQALRLEAGMSKHEILVQYLNRAPYGHGTRGVESAARLYFGKHACDLSLSEATFLAVLPRSPSGYDPYRRRGKAMKRWRHLLGLMLEQDRISTAQYTRALATPPRIQAKAHAFAAPHFVAQFKRDEAARIATSPPTLKSTLDRDLQAHAETLITRHLHTVERDEGLKGLQAATVIVDNASGAILALVGSRDWSDDANLGKNDATLTRRQPGSTLKPFVYALALEAGWTPATPIPDVPTTFSLDEGRVYLPRNYDGRFLGPLRLRQALAGSRNIPAVRALQAAGPTHTLKVLRALGFDSLKESVHHYGLGLALGSGEVSLLELVRAYSTLARGGVDRPLMRRAATVPSRITPLDPRAVWQITDILSDDLSRAAAFGPTTPVHFPFPLALKTGTSAGGRDTWTIGYTPQVTVGVWVGRFDAAPIPNVGGMRTAGPLFADLIRVAMRGRPIRPFERPAGLVEVEVCALSGKRPNHDCPHRVHEHFAADNLPGGRCEWHQRLRLDRRNDLLAGTHCEEHHVETRVLRTLPEDYHDWAETTGLTIQAPPDSPLCDTKQHAHNRHRWALTHPRPNAVFIHDPTRPNHVQTIRLSATRPDTAGHTDTPIFILNGTALKAPPGAHDIRWPIAPGTHRLQVATATGQRSDTIEFQVR